MKETNYKMKTQKNKNLHKAKTAKNDEFYTQFVDIENELGHYKDHFKNKRYFFLERFFERKLADGNLYDFIFRL